jgi:hypothetical protein
MKDGASPVGGALQQDAEALMEHVNASATQAMPQSDIPNMEAPTEFTAN